MITKKPEDITLKEASECINDLQVTERQREFIRAALRALLTAALQKRLACKVDI